MRRESLAHSHGHDPHSVRQAPNGRSSLDLGELCGSRVCFPADVFVHFDFDSVFGPNPRVKVTRPRSSTAHIYNRLISRSSQTSSG